MKRFTAVFLVLFLLGGCLMITAEAAPKLLSAGQLGADYYIPTSGVPISGNDQVVFDGQRFFTAMMTAERQLVGYWFDKDGQQLRQMTQIADLSDTTGNLSQPSLCVLNGSIYVGWVVIADEAMNDYGGAQYLCRISPGGAVSEPICICDENVWPRRPGMAAGEDGLLLAYRCYDLVEQEEDWEWRVHNCYACYVTEDLKAGPSYRLNEEDFAIYPSVAYAEETGRFLVVWEHGPVTGALVTKDTKETPANFSCFDMEYSYMEKPWVASDGRGFLVSAHSTFQDAYYDDDDVYHWLDYQGIWTMPVDAEGRCGQIVHSVTMKDSTAINNGQLAWDGSGWLLSYSCDREELRGYAPLCPDFRLTDGYLVRLDAETLLPEGYPVGVGTDLWHQFQLRFALAGDTVFCSYVEGGDLVKLSYAVFRGIDFGTRELAAVADSGKRMERVLPENDSRFRLGDSDGTVARVMGYQLSTWENGAWVTSENAYLPDDKTFAMSVTGENVGLTGWAGLSSRLVSGETPEEDHFETFANYGELGDGLGLGIWMQDADTCYIASGDGTIWRSQGGEKPVKVYESGAHGEGFHDIHGASPTEIYAVGDRGLIVSYDGSAWTRLASPVSLALNSVRADGQGGAFAVGDGGAVLRIQGGRASLLPSPTKRALYDVWCMDAGRFFTCGAENAVFCCSADGWEKLSLHRNVWDYWANRETDIIETGALTEVFGVEEAGGLRLFCLSCEEEEGLYSVLLSAEAPTPKKSGDLNGDGRVNGKDAVLLAQALAHWDVEYDAAAGDVNGDGKVNGKDAVLLAQYLAGWDVTLA